MGRLQPKGAKGAYENEVLRVHSARNHDRGNAHRRPGRGSNSELYQFGREDTKASVHIDSQIDRHGESAMDGRNTEVSRRNANGRGSLRRRQTVARQTEVP